MKLLFSELRRIQARMGNPCHPGDWHRAVLDNKNFAKFINEGFDSKFDKLDTVDFHAEWGEDPDTHRPKLVWVMRGKFEIVLDCPLTRKKSVLP